MRFWNLLNRIELTSLGQEKEVEHIVQKLPLVSTAKSLKIIYCKDLGQP